MYRYGGSGSKNGKEHADSLHKLASLLGKSKLRCLVWISLGIEGVFQGLPLMISRLKGCRIYQGLDLQICASYGGHYLRG
jgi:hypothetical protein